MNPSSCVILVPANNGIEPACDQALRQLERMGYPVWRVPGFSQINTARSQLATDAIARGFDELMWIDSDTEFDPAAVERLRSHNLPIVSGLYPKNGSRALASSLLPQTQKIVFGEGGGLLEIRDAATGFLLTKRQVYLDIQRCCNLPVCNLQFNKPLVPFFMTMVVEVEETPSPRPSPVPSTSSGQAEGEGDERGDRTSEVGTRSVGDESPLTPHHSPAAKQYWYLSEDFAFSHRARQAGYKIYADSTIRLGHIGRYTYAWEDAGTSLNRYSTFHFQVSDAKPPTQGEADRSGGFRPPNA
jgi:hypothetical protein